MKHYGPRPLPRALRRANRVNAFIGDAAYDGLRAACATSREMSETTDGGAVQSAPTKRTRLTESVHQ